MFALLTAEKVVQLLVAYIIEASDLYNSREAAEVDIHWSSSADYSPTSNRRVSAKRHRGIYYKLVVGVPLQCNSITTYSRSPYAPDTKPEYSKFENSKRRFTVF